MDIQNMSNFLHYNPETGEEYTQVTACGRAANIFDKECEYIDWTTVEEETTCPLCINALERKAKNG